MAGQSVSITIPLHITISLGQPVVTQGNGLHFQVPVDVPVAQPVKHCGCGPNEECMRCQNGGVRWCGCKLPGQTCGRCEKKCACRGGEVCYECKPPFGSVQLR